MSATETTGPTTALGAPDETCRTCGAPLAVDQRYCLECGERRGPTRVPLVSGERVRETEHDAVPPGAFERPSSAPFVAGVIALLLALGVGVLIGGNGDDEAAAPQAPVTVAGAAPTPGQPTADAGAFASDWPAGEKGWTVALKMLPKDGTQPAQVGAAKSAASGKGARDVGALDADEFGSLESGSYVVYSGRYDSKAQAAKAQRKLKAGFPDARVVQVAADAGSSGAGGADVEEAASAAESKATNPALKGLEGSSGADYAKKSRKLGKTVGTGGKAPPKDKKPAAAGESFEAIE